MNSKFTPLQGGRKIWTRTKILSLNIRYFVALLRFVAIYALFGNLWAKKVFFLGQKQCCLGKKCAMVYIAYCNELNLQISNYAQKRRIVAKIVNTHLT